MAGEQLPGPDRHSFVISQSEAGQRLDQVMASHLPDLSRSQLKNRLRHLACAGKAVKPSWLGTAGDLVEFELEALVPLDLRPQDLGLDILYEDRNVAVINKPAGLVVHPGAGNPDGTLVNGLAFRYPALTASFKAGQTRPKGLETDAGQLDDEDELAGPADQSDFRPGIVHRLDKDTSGVMVAALNPESLAFLARQFQERTTRKWYLAIATGVMPGQTVRVEGCICRDPAKRQCFTWSNQKGKPAESTFRVLAVSKTHTLLLVRPHTGRTHQIRVHARHLGYPLLGDPLYGRNAALDRQTRLMLHALALRICLPGQDAARLFMAPLPADMTGIMEQTGLFLDPGLISPEALAALGD